MGILDRPSLPDLARYVGFGGTIATACLIPSHWAGLTINLEDVALPFCDGEVIGFDEDPELTQIALEERERVELYLEEYGLSVAADIAVEDIGVCSFKNGWIHHMNDYPDDVVQGIAIGGYSGEYSLHRGDSLIETGAPGTMQLPTFVLVNQGKVDACLVHDDCAPLSDLVRHEIAHIAQRNLTYAHWMVEADAVLTEDSPNQRHSHPYKLAEGCWDFLGRFVEDSAIANNGDAFLLQFTHGELTQEDLESLVNQALGTLDISDPERALLSDMLLTSGIVELWNRMHALLKVGENAAAIQSAFNLEPDALEDITGPNAFVKIDEDLANPDEFLLNRRMWARYVLRPCLLIASSFFLIKEMTNLLFHIFMAVALKFRRFRS